MPAKYTPEERVHQFWARVRKTDTCWIWPVKQPNEYGVVGVGNRRREKAHRFAWILAHGPIPVGMYVLHNCPGGDNPACVNPAHLWLGTAADNSQDMVKKGRSTAGTRNKHAKLTEAQVREIRAEYAAGGVSHRQIAAAYSITPSLVSFITRRQIWNHI